MRAIVLAGGLGTRLRGVVPDLPKPMAPVAGRPFLAWVLDELVEAGFAQVVLAVGYRNEVIRGHFGDAYRGLPLRYAVEAQPLGTGGAIRQAAALAAPGPLFVLNGDTFLELDHRAMLAAHEAGGEQMTVAACRVDDVARYGALVVEQGHIRGFAEKGGSGPGLINGGTYLLSDALRRQLPTDEAYSFEQRVLVGALHEIRPAVHEARGLFIDIGVPEDYARVQTLLGARRRDA